MNTHLTAAGSCFELYPLRLSLEAEEPIHFRAGESVNFLRGAFGKTLYRGDSAAYSKYFAPVTQQGPSGLRDSPRPFVFRAGHLDGARVAAGETFEVGINLFETGGALGEPAVELFCDAVCAMLPVRLVRAEGREPLRISLEPGLPSARVRVTFVTPTEIKGAEQPDFGPLFARIRDRVSTLRALYGAGALEIDFAAMGERARQIAMTRCEIRQVEAERVSRSTGQRHSLGGFVGVAEYEGELAEFTPYLEAARYTGVGRQTVWGKGQIAWETI